MDITRPQDDLFEVHILASMRSDLDGNQQPRSFSPLEDIGDTYGDPAIGQIYEAYAGLNRKGGIDVRARIGRQPGTRDEPITFDGIAADAGFARGLANVSVFMGTAVHFFDVGSHWGSDDVLGAGIDLQPLPNTGFSADYVVVEDQQEFLPPAGGDITNRAVAFRLWQRFEPFTRMSAAYRLLNGDPRDLSLKAAAADLDRGLDVSISYYRQIHPRQELSYEFAPFTYVMGTSAPFQNIDVRIRKMFGDRIAVDAGYYKRWLLDLADTGTFNKEYVRSFVDLEVADLFLSGLSWMLTGEQWYAEGAHTDTVGTDLTYRRKRGGKEARVSAGTFYSLYKYDHYVDLGLREKVRTYYLEGRHAFARSFQISCRYEYEQAIERYQTLRVGMRYDF